MNTVYIEDDDIYCNDCAIKGDYNPDNFHSIGEADCPQHCGDCGVFLENPLTDDGYKYVIEQIKSFIIDKQGDQAIIKEWYNYYSDGFDSQDYKDIVEDAIG